MRIVRASAKSTNATTASKTINATTTDLPLLVHERRRALDLRNLHLHAPLERGVVDARARPPHLAADPDAAAVRIDTLHDRRLRPDERGAAGADHRLIDQVGASNRTQEHDRCQCARDE